jgi:acetyltransferase-like isoleucine patch superfamily enzyme
MNPTGVYIHPRALVESDRIGAGTRVWANVHVMKDVVIGRDCNICDDCFIETGATIGRGVTIKQHVEICEGVSIGDAVFVGPHVVFTNDFRPRSPRIPFIAARYADKGWLSPTRIENGVTLGANVTVSCGLTVGAWAFAAAGAVIARDVPPFTLVAGNPARPVSHVCACGNAMTLQDNQCRCGACGREYTFQGGRLAPKVPLALWSD